MPIIIKNGTELLDVFSYDKIESDIALIDNNKSFLDNSKEVQDSIRCLYVGQRESATVRFDDEYIDIIGSDDATTCHIALIVDDKYGNCSMCHFDGQDIKKGLENMMNSLISLRCDTSNANEKEAFLLYIVGGFNDDRNMSINLTFRIFKILINLPYNFNLKLCIVSKLNDMVKEETHYPLVYGLGYDIKLKKLFKCNRFLDKGPDLSARSAKHFFTNSVMDIYETKNSQLIIGPFEIDKIKYIEKIVIMPDQFILENFSTSPKQEPPEFAINTRKTLEFILANPKLLDTYFLSSKPHIYTKQQDGSWLPIKTTTSVYKEIHKD